MNHTTLINMLIDLAESRLEKKEKPFRDTLGDLAGRLSDLNGRKEIEPLPPLTDVAKEGADLKYLDKLREHFNDDVTKISLVMHYYFPEKYIYYRVAKFEDEIFEGLSEFFNFDFDDVSKRSMDKYLTINSTLIDFCKNEAVGWADKLMQNRINNFLASLYWLFVEETDYKRYWLFVTRHEEQEEGLKEFRSDGESEWSGVKGMQQGDIAFMYVTAPVSGITDIVEIGDSGIDFLFRWDGIRTDLRHLKHIKPITLSSMKSDYILSKWSPVKMQMQGTTAKPVPFNMYNRLLNYVDEDVKAELDLKPETVADYLPDEKSGDIEYFVSEKDFEDKMISPLLDKWSLKYTREYSCDFHIGVQRIKGRIDYLVWRDGGKQRPLTLIENKFEITDTNMEVVIAQGKSYALQMGLNNFMLSAPQGIWLYSLERNVETLEFNCSWKEINDREAELRKLIQKFNA